MFLSPLCRLRTEHNSTLCRPSSRAGKHDAPSHTREHAPDDLHPLSQYRANAYARQDDSAYEMSEVRDSTTNLTAGGGAADAGDAMGAFYAEVRMLSSRHDMMLNSSLSCFLPPPLHLLISYIRFEMPHR